MPGLATEDLTAGYGALTAVWDMCIEVRSGEVAIAVGPNGAGKSTLLGAIFGVVAARSGRVRLNGSDITKLPYPERRAAGLGWLPEGRAPFAHLTVQDNLYVSAWLAGQRRSFDAAFAELCDRFPVLGRKRSHRAASLSGGEQQIVGLARVLIQKPSVVMLDEPTTGLAPTIVQVLRDTVVDLKHRGTAWLITEQNVDWLLPIADVAYVISGGRIIGHGDAGVVATRDKLRRAYLGGPDGTPVESAHTG